MAATISNCAAVPVGVGALPIELTVELSRERVADHRYRLPAKAATPNPKRSTGKGPCDVVGSGDTIAVGGDIITGEKGVAAEVRTGRVALADVCLVVAAARPAVGNGAWRESVDFAFARPGRVATPGGDLGSAWSLAGGEVVAALSPPARVESTGAGRGRAGPVVERRGPPLRCATCSKFSSRINWLIRS